MTSEPFAQLLVDLGVTHSHSRLHVSNDNPYSEAQFIAGLLWLLVALTVFYGHVGFVDV